MVSEELKKMFEGRIEMQDMHYVGKACYGRLEENLRGKIELGQGFMDSGYTRLTVSVLERTNGLVDQMKFLISDVTGLKQETEGERLGGLMFTAFVVVVIKYIFEFVKHKILFWCLNQNARI